MEINLINIMIPVTDDSMIAFCVRSTYSPAMTPGNDPSIKLLADAEARAASSGNTDVADYLRLRAGNDLSRQEGVSQLIASFIAAVSPYMAARPKLMIDRIDGHRFGHGSSYMTGTLFEMRHGVRCLTVEAGWVRTPGDGIMRNGALAIALVKHFGMPAAAQVLRLMPTDSGRAWIGEGEDAPITVSLVESHVRLLLELE